jgi:hypothetical protein
MTRLGVLCAVAALAFAPQAADAAKLKGKFKVLSASGRQTLTFHEDVTDFSGDRCAGTTTAEASWRARLPKTFYVFQFHSGRSARIGLSDDRVGQVLDSAHVRAVATVVRTVDYQVTAGCRQPPTPCPGATRRATVYLTGTRERHGGSVFASIVQFAQPQGVDLSCTGFQSPVFPGFTDPFGTYERQLFPRIKDAAQALSRRKVIDPHRKRVKDSDTYQLPFSANDPQNAASLSGLYTDHLEISLKRLKLKRKR